MANLMDALDDVLARVAAGESLEGCLAPYPDLAVELIELVGVRDRLSALTPAPALPVGALAAHRRQFLATARTYKRQSVSAHPFQRFLEWGWPAQRTGQPALLPVLARVAIGVILVLSIVGGAVAAAQSSLPHSPLYSVKLIVEDARLNLASDPSQQAALAMTFASERTREMEQLAIAHLPISTLVSLRLQNQLDTALNAAARAPEPEMLRLLDQVRTMAQTQERALAQAQVNAPREAGTQDALRLAEQAVTLALQRAQAGLADPDAFRRQYRHGQGAPVQPTPEVTATPQLPTPTAHIQPTTTLEATVAPPPTHTPQASITPQRNQAGTGQPSTSVPGPQVTVTPRQTGPGPQPTGQGGPVPQPTSGSGGGTSGSGSGGGIGGNAGGTRRP